MRTFAPANGHAALVDMQEEKSAVLTRARSAPPFTLRLELSARERRSLELLGDDLREAIDAAISTAGSLVGDNPTAARLEVIAKDIAFERARQLEYSRRLDELLCGRDLEAAVVFDRMLNSVNQRICRLLAEHRASYSAGYRAAIVVGHADNVRVHAGK